jgi:hypothetical protein
MLARIFTGPEAISVWVELVQKQKERIQGQQDDMLYAHENRAVLLAAQQEILRSDLAKWDASARAWLQSADEAKVNQHKQAMLILANASLPINSETEVYSSVIKAWTVALEAMNNLVKGIPQRVHDGAALLALSSWHLYPDMVFYGETCVEVKQKDLLFDSAILTLGLQQVRSESKSVYWSLPLACLQHYGHPIQTHRTLDQGNRRITFQQFAFILMGCLFDNWKEFARDNDQGIQWLEQLGRICRVSTDHRIYQAHSLPCAWLIYLLQAIRGLSDCDESESRTARQLMNLGRRRSNFLQFQATASPPIFGLSRADLLLPLCSSDEHRMELLRRYSASLGLDGSDLLVLFHPAGNPDTTEYATVKPVTPGSSKRVSDGRLEENDRLPPRHIRWASLTYRQLKLCNRHIETFRNLVGATHHLKTLKDRKVTMINPNVDKVFQRSGFLQKSSSDAPPPWNVRRKQGAEDYGHDLTSNRQLSRECEEHTQSDPPLTLDQAHSSTRNWSDPTPAGVMHMDQEWWRQPMKQSTQQSTLPVSTEEPQGRRDQDYSLLVTEISELEEVIAICERRLYVESSGELFLPIAEYEMNPGHANLQRDLVFSRKEDFLEAV